MEFIRIVIMGVVAACVYGIAQDQVTARVCVEYFTIGHPPVFNTDSPTLLALGWGVIATWWVGLPLGLLMGLASRVGPWPRFTWRDLLRPVAIVLCVMATLALLAGTAGYFVAKAGGVWLVEPLASRVPAERHALFLADLWAHLAAYASGFLGGVGLCVWGIVARGRRAVVKAGGICVVPTSPENMNALSAFATVAAEYCALIDSLGESRPADLYGRLEVLLSRLSGAILPVEKEMPEKEHAEFEKLGMTNDQWIEVARIIGKATGEETGRLFIEHGGAKPDDNEIEKYCAFRAEILSGDLADIYRDLHDGLALWNLASPDAQAQAAWEWRFVYEAHWGDHLFRAMTTVYDVRYMLYED